MSEPRWMHDDHIREAVITAASRQKLTAYAIEKRMGREKISGAVSRYMTRRCHLNTLLVSQICDVLGLSLTSDARRKESL